MLTLFLLFSIITLPAGRNENVAILGLSCVFGILLSFFNTVFTTPKIGYFKYLDQVSVKTCTIHAIATAACNDLMTRNIKINIDRYLGALLSSFPENIVRNGVFPSMLNVNGKIIHNQINTSNGHNDYGKITLDIIKKSFQPGFHHILVYNANQIHQEQAYGHHCVLIERLDNSQKVFHCVTNGGKNNNPDLDLAIIPVNSPGLEVYQVSAHWEPVCGHSSIDPGFVSMMYIIRMIMAVSICNSAIFTIFLFIC